MQKLRILIVEDELIIAESIKSTLESMGYEVAGIFTSGIETLEIFRPGFADIIIMDINLADNTNGIDTSIEIRKISTAPIIYITDNTDDYTRKKAIYETDTVHYITKPFSKMDLEIAIDLAIKAIKGKNPLLRKTISSSYLIDECIFIKDIQGYKKVMLNDIILLKADGSYCNLVCKISDTKGNKIEEQNILFSENLSFLEEKFSFSNDLVRIHRSYIVNINHVNKIHENRLWIGEKEFPIGKTFRNDIRGRFRFI